MVQIELHEVKGCDRFHWQTAVIASALVVKARADTVEAHACE